MITRDDIALGWWRALPPYRVDMKAAWQLPEYSATNPTGVTVGKTWRRLNGAHDEVFKRLGGRPRWVICRYEDAPDSYQMTNYLMSPTGKPVRIEDVSLEESVKSPRMYTRTQMCKIVTYRPVVRVKMGRHDIGNNVMENGG